jgi:hypothetical protein
MAEEWTDPSHVGKISVSIMDILFTEFKKESEKDEDTQDIDKLIKLSQATGYQAQVFSGLQKNHEFAKRLQSVEKLLSAENQLELKIAKKIGN